MHTSMGEGHGCALTGFSISNLPNSGKHSFNILFISAYGFWVFPDLHIFKGMGFFARHGNNLSVHQRMNEENILYTYNGILFSQKKEGNSAICDNMDEP